MPLTKDELIAKLKDAGVSFESFEHPPVMTVEAQIAALPGNPQTVLKNLFVKDKKHRCYIITALPDTKIDMQVLSARLGTGKGGLRLAPEELLLEVLQVPLGSVTPLAVANPEAADVVLLLDDKIKAQQVVYVHPLVNTTSLALGPAALEAALKAVGRDPLFVDLEADPKIDRDNPPDLKATADAAKPPAAALPPADGATPAPPADAKAGAAAAAAAPAAKDAGKKDAAKKDGKGGSKGADQKKGGAATLTALTAVGPRVEEVLSLAVGALLGAGTTAEAAVAEGRVDAYALARLRADLEMQLSSLKNAAYAAGHVAGKGEVVAHAERRYA
ncbi:hypothetical protein CHLRE_10g425950v5 [Chlamydomonas reinhardtii]|uniref:YbaK/aminoacyl-tRNA synthetase-associated domain-containing protein n=1 Tax=Chlamydomonas reinhardtii TaxID=3055 RepID=A0A2K3D9I0_CHLRE|nr:uncharacterized protein CHLRE_10g425950v5 [Chlamydomonas reinhardtii]PNW77186.1 hypothetical protein CHLRE_10g425950v5 [Chlamydomonas reinhardtii]